jgi:hypothetical protein
MGSIRSSSEHELSKPAPGPSLFISVRVAAICTLLIVGSAIGCRFLGDGQTLTAALKLVTAAFAVGVVPGALATMLWWPRRALTLLEVIGFGAAISFGLVHLLAVLAVSAHVGAPMILGMLAIGSTLMAIRTVWRPFGLVVITLDELIVLSLLLALSVFLYNLGSPVTWWEDQVHVSVVRRLSELAAPRLDNLYVTPGIVYAYPIPGTHYFMALIARLSDLDALFVYHKLRFFWGPIALVMLHLAARAVFGPRGIASGVTVTAAALVGSGAFAMVPGFDSGWGQLATFSHASDVAMNVLLPALLVVAGGYLTGETPRERSFFLMATVMLVVMLTMVHIREIVQPAVYFVCFTLVAAMVRPFRIYLRRSVALLAVVVSIAAIYVLWQREVVGLVGDIVDNHRAQLTSIVATTPFWELVATPAPMLLSDFLINSDQVAGGLIPLFLFAGPAVLLVFSERPLMWLVVPSTLVYLAIMTLPLLAIPYIYLTYFEILYTPVRNVAFFVYLIAGSAVCAGILALARIDRTQLLPLAAGALAGALTILVSLSLNRRAGEFIAPLIAAYGLGCLLLWAASSLRTKRIRAVAALALGLLGLVALFPEREVAQRANQVSVRWTSDLPDAERMTLERQFSLTAAEPNSNHSQDVNVWNYDITDPSPGNIKALVNHPRVVDTNDIDPGNFTVRAQPPEDDDPYVGVSRIAWLQYPGFLLFVAATVFLWMLGFVVPAALASPAGRRAVASLQPALNAPFYRSAVPFVLFMIPFTLLTARPTLSPLTTAPSLSGGRADTPASMIERIPCVTARGAAARFAADDDVVPERTTCPPDRDLTEWVRKNVPPDGVFAVDRWMAYAPQVFMPQQAVAFPALDATFLNEDQLFGDYYRFFDERMQRDRVQPFFNAVETAAERAAFVEALGVTHVLVNPPYYAELREALDALPELFTLQYDRGQWAVYEVIRKSPAGGRRGS